MAMKESLSYKLKRLMPYIWRERRTLAVIVLLTLLGAATAALMPWPLKILVDYALDGAELPQSVRFVPDYFSLSLSPLLLITAASVASLGLFWLSSALDVAQTWSWSAMGQRMVYSLASGLFNKLLRLSPVFHGNKLVYASVHRKLGVADGCRPDVAFTCRFPGSGRVGRFFRQSTTTARETKS
jgi:ATP-binding cassette subfamily B protein/subfamily B ATP-binding cassette protein MsbA